MSRNERLVAAVLGVLLFAGLFTVIYTSLFRSGGTAALDEFDDGEFDYAIGEDTSPLSGLFDEPADALPDPAPAPKPAETKPAASKPAPGSRTRR